MTARAILICAAFGCIARHEANGANFQDAQRRVRLRFEQRDGLYYCADCAKRKDRERKAVTHDAR